MRALIFRVLGWKTILRAGVLRVVVSNAGWHYRFLILRLGLELLLFHGDEVLKAFVNARVLLFNIPKLEDIKLRFKFHFLSNY